MGKRPRTTKQPPLRFAWFFGYHVFDVLAARRVALLYDLPAVELPAACLAPLLADGAADLDIVRTIDPRTVALLARVPLDGERDRFILIDGYEAALKCQKLGRPLRLRILSKRLARMCRIEADSSGEWHEGLQ